MDEKKPSAPKSSTSSAAPTAPPATAAPAAPSAPAGKTSGVAIAAIIFAFLFPLIGLILGIIALTQIKKNHEGGKGLAVASIVISIIIMVVGFLAIFGFAFAIRQAAKNAGVNVNGNGSVSVQGKNGDSLSVGGSVKIPDGFPSNVPIYKPSDAIAALKTSDGYNVTLATNDDPQKVLDFYTAQLPAKGWQNNNSDVTLGIGNAISYTQGNQQLLIFISNDKNASQGKKTGINLTVANNANANNQ